MLYGVFFLSRKAGKNGSPGVQSKPVVGGDGFMSSSAGDTKLPSKGPSTTDLGNGSIPPVMHTTIQTVLITPLFIFIRMNANTAVRSLRSNF